MTKKFLPQIMVPIAVIALAMAYVYHLRHFQDLYPIYFQPPAIKFPHRLYYLGGMGLLALLFLYCVWYGHKNRDKMNSATRIIILVLNALGVAALIYFGLNL